MAKKNSPPGRARDRGEVEFLAVEIAADLGADLERFRQDDNRTKRFCVELAIEEFLVKRGYRKARRKSGPPHPPADEHPAD